MPRKKTGTSMQDIADTLGISKNAVSIALSGRPGVGNDLRQRIIALASQLNYDLGPKSNDKPEKNFLVLVPDYLAGENIYYTNVYWGIEYTLKEMGHHVMITSVSPAMIEKKKIPLHFNSFEFAGIFLIGALPESYIEAVVALKLPTVLVDHSSPGQLCSSILPANQDGAFQVVSHLVDQGHEHIGFVGPVDMSPGLFDRYAGYQRAMRSRGLTVAPEDSILGSWPLNALDDEVVLNSGIAGMRRLPTAFFCATDMIALRIMQLLRNRGYDVPGDVSVAGFDDIQAAHLSNPRLCTYRAPRVEMGREAARYLCSLSDDESVETLTMKRCIYGSLQIRESVAARKKETPVR